MVSCMHGHLSNTIYVVRACKSAQVTIICSFFLLYTFTCWFTCVVHAPYSAVHA
jgi:hypothetical protein